MSAAAVNAMNALVGITLCIARVWLVISFLRVREEGSFFPPAIVNRYRECSHQE